jgi:putative membrane protein
MIRTTVLLLVTLAWASFASAQEPLSVGEDDLAFLQKAIPALSAEAELGQLAQQKCSAQAVKNFAQKIAVDNTKASNRLQTLAANKGIVVPGTFEPKDQALYDRLAKLSGNAFDRAYISAMITDDSEDVAEFRKESQTAHDAQIRSFSSSTLPILEEHLRMAKQIGMQVGTAPASTSSH